MKLRDLIVPFLAALIMIVMFGTLTTWLFRPHWFEPIRAPQAGFDEAGRPVVRRAKGPTLPPEVVPIQRLYDQDRLRPVIAQVDALENPPHSALLLKAWALYKLGLHEPALGTFEAILATTPADPHARAGAGYCALRLGRESEAEAHFVAALEAEPNREDALFGLGYAHFRQGHREAALRYLEGGLALDPGNVEARDLADQLRNRETELESAAPAAP